MIKPVSWIFGIALTVVALGLGSNALAQSPGDAKRTLKAQKLFYKEPGMIEVELRAMRKTLLITGYVPTDAHMKKADELAGDIKGIKDVRNRIRVREPDVAAAGDEIILASIEKKIKADEELDRARRRFELEVTDGNVSVTGKLPDYVLADALVDEIRDTAGVKTIDFDKLKY